MEQASSQQFSMYRRATPTILAVDADRTRLNALAQRLGNLGYLVVLGDTGTQALELVAARGFDLILLERGLPGVSGMHALREIRGSRDTADLPVVLLGGDSDDHVDAFGAGADDCIAHPIDFGLLAARIDRILMRATRFDEIRRSNLALDARIAARAIELGEIRSELATVRVERARLLSSIRSLHAELGRLPGVEGPA